MPRPQPLTREPVQEVRPKPLYRADRKPFARALGLDTLPDACMHAIAWLIAAHKASRDRMKGQGHTPAKVAAGLRRIEGRLRRGHDSPEAVREIKDPHFGMDYGTVVDLSGIMADREVPLDRRLAALQDRIRQVETLPEVDAQHGLRVVLVAFGLVCVWSLFAVRRDDHARQWQFVLLLLEAAGEGTSGLREHPERLKRDVGRLLQLTAGTA